MKSLATLQVPLVDVHENADTLVEANVAVHFIAVVRTYSVPEVITAPVRVFGAPFVVQASKTTREYSDLAFAWSLAEFAFAMYPVIEGTKINANIAKMAITTINSIRVKPFLLRFFFILFPLPCDLI